MFNQAKMTWKEKYNQNFEIKMPEEEHKKPETIYQETKNKVDAIKNYLHTNFKRKYPDRLRPLDKKEAEFWDNNHAKIFEFNPAFKKDKLKDILGSTNDDLGLQIIYIAVKNFVLECSGNNISTSTSRNVLLDKIALRFIIPHLFEHNEIANKLIKEFLVNNEKNKNKITIYERDLLHIAKTCSKYGHQDIARKLLVTCIEDYYPDLLISEDISTQQIYKLISDKMDLNKIIPNNEVYFPTVKNMPEDNQLHM